MNKISVIHPSRGRAKRAFDTARIALFRKSGIPLIEYIMSVDKSDPTIEEYFKLKNELGLNIRIVVNDNNYCIQAMNAGASLSTGEILVGLSDDFDDMPMFWDSIIINAFKNKTDPTLLKTYDGAQKWICTLPIMNRELYNKLGYIYNPEYLHMFADTDLSSICDLMDCVMYRNDIKFPHNHYTFNGKKDKVNERNDSTWNQGEEVYLRRFKENFGLRSDEIFGKIQGKSHLAWVKNKLKI